MRLTVEKAARRLRLWRGGEIVYECRVALGCVPEGAKHESGDMRTPEGEYLICLIKPDGKYGRSLGIDYPSPRDAEAAYAEGLIDAGTLDAIKRARAERRRPPWGTPLGGEIYIHEGGSQSDWTAGCIALDARDMDAVFDARDEIESVYITK